MGYCKYKKESSVPTSLLLHDLIAGFKGCVVEFGGIHYEAIITKKNSKSSSASALKWPRKASFSVCNSDCFKNYLFSICKK